MVFLYEKKIAFQFPFKPSKPALPEGGMSALQILTTGLFAAIF
jgi:hypothetical protein